MHLRDANTPATETKPSQWSLFQPTDPPTPSTISISTPQSQQHFSNTPIPHLPVELIEDIISYLIIPPKQLFQIATALRIDRLRRKSIPFIPEASIDNASAKGQVELLQWWKESNLSLEYTEKSVLEACRNGHVDVIQWWLDSGLPIKYKDWLGVDGVMVAAAEGGHVDVMKVWSGSGLEFNVSDIEIDVASANGHVDVLEWCTGESKHEFRWSTQALDMASANGYVNVLDWWVASALPLKYTADSMDKASTNGTLGFWSGGFRVG
ncbi:hypothetical protein BCR33DRAFT_785022 [Rhizoclosmatium globosum]|uniref:Uncharacterized protein n=1 Tax=Rhizoclosmatium globosum TaxID=329046 RepID=A0A1Y2CBB1_9FUNG|nr:hypothetical protein BCR33DRAFT_785022 [Rhizoclosmatium globosum]|eukprot:ORY44322.1 hypothetical protein BCR33DRAFT_785022 [Rhizoclosmatium globosum]